MITGGVLQTIAGFVT